MATTTRGKVLNSLPARGRGTCPQCGRTRIKLLYELHHDNEQTVKVCKNCRPKKKLRRNNKGELPAEEMTTGEIVSK